MKKVVIWPRISVIIPTVFFMSYDDDVEHFLMNTPGDRTEHSVCQFVSRILSRRENL